jgi:hypothetical protein
VHLAAGAARKVHLPQVCDRRGLQQQAVGGGLDEPALAVERKPGGLQASVEGLEAALKGGADAMDRQRSVVEAVAVGEDPGA